MELGFFGRTQGERRHVGVVVVLRLSKLDFVYAESVFLPSVGGECKESTDGVSYRRRPPTVGENLFETCFGFRVNEII